MDIIGKNMWDFVYVKTKPFKDGFGINGQPAGAKLEARVMFLFENQDLGREMRGDALEMQRGGESAGAASDDENVRLVH